MPELKRIRVRKAKLRDIGLFRKLWMEWLKQNEQKGSLIVPDSESLNYFELFFNLYTEEGASEGIVLFVADKAVLMWGAIRPSVHYKIGKLAMAWGHYVAPDSPDGLEEALLSEAKSWAGRNGFSGVIGQFSGDLPDGFKASDIEAYWVF